MINNRARVAPIFGAPQFNRPNFKQFKKPSASLESLRFEGPVLKTPVAFQGKHALERQTPMQTALQQASMILTIPVLLGVNSIAYLTGNKEPELILIEQPNSRLNLIA